MEIENRNKIFGEKENVNILITKIHDNVISGFYHDDRLCGISFKPDRSFYTNTYYNILKKMDIKIGDVLKFTTKSIPGSVDMKVELCDDNIENIMKGLRELSVDKSDTVSSYFIKIIKDIRDIKINNLLDD